jgi:hypothetical protein
MQLSKQAIDEFKAIYKEEFGENIDDKKAYELAVDLLNLFKIIYRPIPKHDTDEKKNISSSKS